MSHRFASVAAGALVLAVLASIRADAQQSAPQPGSTVIPSDRTCNNGNHVIPAPVGTSGGSAAGSVLLPAGSLPTATPVGVPGAGPAPVSVPPGAQVNVLGPPTPHRPAAGPAVQVGGAQAPASLGPVSAPPVAPGDEPAGNLIRREPALIFDVTGLTLLGEVRRQLVVYNDGLMHLTESVGATGTQRIALASIPPERVHHLQLALWQAGAYSLEDQPLVVADLPLRTLTVFSGATDALAHTASYWIADGPHASVDALVEDLIEAHFAR